MATADDYGQIVTRDDFFRVLAEARAYARQRLAAVPGDPVFQAIDVQLESMERWSADGRTPSPEERSRVCIGLIAVRELDGDPDEAVEVFAASLHELNNYFEDWP